MKLNVNLKPPPRNLISNQIVNQRTIKDDQQTRNWANKTNPSWIKHGQESRLIKNTIVHNNSWKNTKKKNPKGGVKENYK